MEELKSRLVRESLALGMDVCGVASAEAVNDLAPVGFRPEDVLEGARSVIVIGLRMPAATTLASASPEPGELLSMRSFWNTGWALDMAAHA